MVFLLISSYFGNETNSTHCLLLCSVVHKLLNCVSQLTFDLKHCFVSLSRKNKDNIFNVVCSIGN